MSTPNKSRPAALRHETLAAALAAFQANLPEVRLLNEGQAEEHDGSVRSYRYAGLPDISAEALPALGAQGLAFTALPTTNQHGLFVLAYSLTHEAGESITGEFPLPDPVTTAPDEFGQRIAAARRHALTALTGVAPGGHDDQEARRSAATPPAETPTKSAVPERDWIAEARAATSKEEVAAIWDQVRSEVLLQRASAYVLDEVAAIARDFTSEREPSAETKQ